jgi:hypothetical protein
VSAATETRTCTGKWGCGKTKPVSEFTFQASVGRYRTNCKPCRAAAEQVMRESRPKPPPKPKKKPEPITSAFPGDPPIRTDKRCALDSCGKRLPALSIKHLDPFCSSKCCRTHTASS